MKFFYWFFCLTLISTLVCFQNCVFADPIAPGITNEDNEISSRLTYIQTSLDEGAVSANRWYYSWMIFYGSNAYLSLGTSIAMDDPDDSDLRFDSKVNFVLSSYAAASLYFTPVPAKNAAELLRKIPATSPMERRLALQIAETYLMGCASVEKGWGGWKPHLFAGLVNAAGGMTIAFGDNRKKDGLVNFLVGMLIAELQIFTAPGRAIDDWEKYNQRFNTSYRVHHQPSSWLENFKLFAYHRGCGIHYQF